MNLCDRMVDIYNEGHVASVLGDGLRTNPYPQGSAEHHCWAHGWHDDQSDLDNIVETLMSGGPDCFGRITDGRGRFIAEAWPAEGGSA